MASLNETQVELAQRVYSARAKTYEDSWHPDYTARFMSLISIKPGDHVLLLACGTGLEIDIAAPQVGEQGLVVGVDVTKDMLQVAKQKLNAKPSITDRVKLVEHDATDLSTCSEIEKDSFDWILCSSAFVLFDNPAGVVKLWKQYLRPGGKMAIDITHEHNLRQGLFLEKVAKRLGIPYPSNRSWITSRYAFQDILESEGLVVDLLQELPRYSSDGKSYYDVSEADEQFDHVITSPLSKVLRQEKFETKARSLFVEEWEAAAVDGKVHVSDSVYVYVARRVV